MEEIFSLILRRGKKVYKRGAAILRGNIEKKVFPREQADIVVFCIPMIQ